MPIRSRNLRFLIRSLAVTSSFVAGLGSSANADFIFQTVNDEFIPAPFYWASPSGNIGWYWTPDSDVWLTGVQTRLTTGYSNINNNFTMTASLWTDRPAAGGTLIDSFAFQANVPIDGLWLGGFFGAPLELTGGIQYFLGFSGWEQVLTNNGGGGVNWIENPAAPGAQNLGAGSGYTGLDWSIKMNNSNVPANIDSPILRFFATPIPEPSSLALVGLGLTTTAFAAFRRRRPRERSLQEVP